MSQMGPTDFGQLLLQAAGAGANIRNQRESLRQRQNEFDRSIVLDEVRLGLAELAEARAAESQKHRIKIENQQAQRAATAFEQGQQDRSEFRAFGQAYGEVAGPDSGLSIFPEPIRRMLPPEVMGKIALRDAEARGDISRQAALRKLDIDQKFQELLGRRRMRSEAVREGLISEERAAAENRQDFQQALQLDMEDDIRQVTEGLAYLYNNMDKRVLPMFKVAVENHMRANGGRVPAELIALGHDLATASSTTSMEGRIARSMQMEPLLQQLGMRQQDIDTTIARDATGQPIPYRGGEERAKIPESVDEIDAKGRYEAANKLLTELEHKASSIRAGETKYGGPNEADLAKEIKAVRQNVAVLRRQWDNLRSQRVGEITERPTSQVQPAPVEDAVPEIQGVGRAAPEDLEAALNEWLAMNPKKKDERNEQYKERARKTMVQLFGGG